MRGPWRDGEPALYGRFWWPFSYGSRAPWSADASWADRYGTLHDTSIYIKYGGLSQNRAYSTATGSHRPPQSIVSGAARKAAHQLLYIIPRTLSIKKYRCRFLGLFSQNGPFFPCLLTKCGIFYWFISPIYRGSLWIKNCT